MKYLLSQVLRSPDAEGAAPPPPPDEGLSDEAAREILAFDPFKVFAPPAKEGQGGSEGEESPKGDGSAEGVAPKKAEPPSPPADDQGPADKGEGEDPRIKELREAVQGFLTKPPSEPKAEPKPAEPTPQPEAKPQAPADDIKYEMAVPEEIVDALAHEDAGVRRKGINALVNGVANKLAKDFGAAMAAGVQHAIAEAVKQSQAVMDGRTNEQRVRDDFYNTYPDIKELADNLPALDGVVWQTAQQIAQATGQKGWTPQLRDQVGATLRLQLRLATPQGEAKPVPQGNGQRTPRKASFSAGGGGGPSARQNGADAQNDFMSVLGAGQ